ncbi:MAG: sugar ABC transporter substrate-binding protein, partial [Thermomicrobiales bacterium]|nr:sugar ABC transporter substrate-binding protein [Thermomicrobiales bacterium]
MLTRGSRRRRTPIVASAGIALALLAAMLLAALAPQAGAQTSTVRFAFWGDPAEEAAYTKVVLAFEELHPDIDIQTDYTPGQGDYYQKVSTSFAGGNAPDIFLINYRNFGQYAARDALEPVQSYLDASETLAAADYYDASMDAFRFDGVEQTCMPQNVSSLVVYYNEDLFEANGVPFPETGWTWDDFLTAAKALTTDPDGDGTMDTYGVVMEQSLYRFTSFMSSNGGQLVDDIHDPTTLTIDSPEALEALAMIANLGENGEGVTPPETEAQAEDDEARFMRGGAGMFLQSRRAVPTLREIDGFTWNVAPLPVIDMPATVLHSDAFCMAATTADKAAAWTFIEFAVGVEGQSLLAETGRIVPALKSVAESDAFLAPI